MTILPIIFDNPIFLRELRRRMRGKAMIFFLCAYVFIVCLVSFLLLVVQSQTLDPSKGLNYIQQIGQIGKTVFFTVLCVQALLVLLVAPSITAGMITAERERQTFDFLRVTTISPSTFVAGGLVSTLMYVLLVQVCALPVLCVPFLYGGMSPTELTGWFATLMGASLVLCSVGLYLSSIKQRTRSAQGAMLVITLALMFTTFFVLPMMAFRANVGGLSGPLWNSYPLFQGQLMAPGWALFIAICVFISALFLIAACRKLYDQERHAFSYLQFLILEFIILLGVMGMTWGVAKTTDLTFWFYLGTLLLLLAVMIFCTGKMSVGDDLWRLKRRIPIFQQLDESLFYLAMVVAMWAAASAMFVGGGLSVQSVGEDALFVAVLITVAPMLFFGVVARLLSLWLPSALAVLRTMLVLAVALLLVFPLLLTIAALLGRGAADPTLIAMAGISPFFALPNLFDAIENGAGGGGLAECLFLPGGVAAMIYLAMAALAFLLYIPASIRHMRSTNYHFDLPG